MTTNQIRTMLKIKKNEGAIEGYQIKADGSISIKSTMPNTNQIGWWYAGNVEDIDIVRLQEKF